MTSDYPDLIADLPEPLDDAAEAPEPPEPFLDLLPAAPEPYGDLIPDLPLRTQSPQTWNVTIADAKYHWYDLIAGFPAMPDIRDPVGRHLRRMQFDLEATMEKRLIYFAVNRPRVRFDTSRSTSWGFFSLNLTVPILVGAEGKRDSVTLELEVPFAATLKKPNVVVTDRFITLNWGGLIEALSIHDVLQQFKNDLVFPSIVQYVGQTKDPSGRLAKARLAPIQRLHHQHSENNDMLLLVQRMNVEVISDDGDPSDLPGNQNPVAADALTKDRMDTIECALIRYFEGSLTHSRSDREGDVRRARLREVQANNNLEHFRIDLRLEGANNYHDLQSPHVPMSRNHVLDCRIVDGELSVTRVPDKAKAKG